MIIKHAWCSFICEKDVDNFRNFEKANRDLLSKTKHPRYKRLKSDLVGDVDAAVKLTGVPCVMEPM